MKINPHRIRWEDVPFAIVALGTESMLIYFHVFRESLIHGNLFFEFLKEYGCYVGLAFLIPSFAYFVCEFIVSIKRNNIHKAEIASKIAQRRARMKENEILSEEFDRFYEENFKK